MWPRRSWVRVPLLTPFILLSAILGCSQVAKATDFDSVIRRFKSCHPSQPDPLAQSVEHLTFNQGVRSSNLRRVTRDARSMMCGRGGIGRRARFRFWCRQAYEFKSLRPHQFGCAERNKFAGVAHLVERSLAKAEVAGSSPVSRSRFAGIV